MFLHNLFHINCIGYLDVIRFLFFMIYDNDRSILEWFLSELLMIFGLKKVSLGHSMVDILLNY